MTQPDPETEVSRRNMTASFGGVESIAVESLVDMLFDHLRYDYATPAARAATVNALRSLSEDELAALKRDIEEHRVFSPVFAVREFAARQSAEEDEAESILARVDSELTAEEALTRQLMTRHGL